MTRVPKSLLVRRVQKALELADAEFQSNPALPCRSRHLALAALAACEAEEMREVLGLLVYAKEMKERSGDSPAYRAKKDEGWARARALLARLEAKP